MNQFDMEELCKHLAPVIADALLSTYREARSNELHIKRRRLTNELFLIETELQFLNSSFGGAK